MPAMFRLRDSDQVFDLNGEDLLAETLFDEWHGRLAGRHRGRFLCATADCRAPDAAVYFKQRHGTRYVCHYSGSVEHPAHTLFGG